MAKRHRNKTKDQTATASRTSPWLGIWERSWLPPLLFLLLSLVYFREFVATDQIIFGYDIGQDFHRGAEMTFREKVATLVQPSWHHQMGGHPVSEEIRPQYAPTYLIYFFTTFQRHIGWRYILMAFLAGWGMFAFVRDLSLRRLTAVWAGVAYMSAPTFLAFTYAGHYAKMGVITLFPWMVLVLFRGMRSRRPFHFALLGLLIGVGVYTPHVQMLYHALLALGLIFLYLLVEHFLAERDWRRLGLRTLLFAAAAAVGLGIGAEGVFPLYNYSRTESKRADSEVAPQTLEAQLQRARSWSLHPEEVASLVIPEFGGFSHPGEGTTYYWGRNPVKDNSEYFGVLAVLLAIVGLVLPGRGRLALFLGGLFVLVLAYTLGGHTPVHGLAFHLLPGARVMRAVGMAAFIFAFAAIVLAALGLDRLLEAKADAGDLLQRRLLQVGGALTAVALIVALAPEMVTDLWISVLYASITPDKQAVLARGYDWLARGGLLVAGVCGAGTLILYLHLRQQMAASWAVAGLCLLTLFDTWRISSVFLQYEDPGRYADIRRENPETVRFLKQHDEPLRIFPVPDYRLLQTPGFHLHEVPVVTGFHDFTLARYDRVLQELHPVTTMLQARYYQGRDVPFSDAQLLESIAPLLNLLNARYIVAPRGAEIQSEVFPPVFVSNRFQVYENRAVMPFFYLPPEYRLATDGEEALRWLRAGEVDLHREVVLERSPPAWMDAAPSGSHRVEDHVSLEIYDLPGGHIRLQVHGAGPRILVVSQNYHDNWRARVDGEPVEILRANYIWKGIPLTGGTHTVDLVYHSAMVQRTRMVSGASVLLVLGVLVLEGWLGRRKG